MPASGVPPILPGASFGTALVFSVLLTFLICVIEFPNQAKVSLRACLVWTSVPYLIIRAIGNAVTTVLAYPLLKPRLGDLLDPSSYMLAFLDAFAGVFAFHFVLSHTNVTVFQKGVLTIEDWIAKALENAIGPANKKEAKLTEDRTQRLVDDLDRSLTDEAQLNAQIDAAMGVGTAGKLAEEAGKSGSDVKMYKLLAFATAKPDRAASIVGARRRRRQP